MRISPGRRCVNGPPEVGYFKISFQIKQQVLRLDVPVDDVLAVTISAQQQQRRSDVVTDQPSR